VSYARDTVGGRLAASIRDARLAEMWSQRACQSYTTSGDPSLHEHLKSAAIARAAEQLRLSASCRGSASGHAFRAAELAYDLGERYATSRRWSVEHADLVGEVVEAAARGDFDEIDLSDVDPAALDAVFPEREDDGT
jgi:hypothetical protein